MNSLQDASYDVVTVGGGMAAASFAKSMATRGAKVLVLEQELRFRDRVRGEYLVPWGVAEARELGVLDCLLACCAREIALVDLGFGPRDLRSTTPQQMAGLAYPHPEMQETLLLAAAASGAIVRRGAVVTAIEPGAQPRVSVSHAGKSETISTRLVAAADGRQSPARKSLGFSTKASGDPFCFAGVLLTDVCAREDIAWFIFNPELGLVGALVPQSPKKFRAYLGFPNASGYRFSGKSSLPRFLSESRRVAPVFGDCYQSPQDIGPLATFDGGHNWAEHPYRDGVALLGDAAATSDPSFGQGMALSLRDARTLRDSLVSESNWDAAGHRYAELHDDYHARCRTASAWFRAVFQEQGAEADERRRRAMPLIAQDPMRVPDHLFGGPDLPLDDSVRARFFGEC